MESSISKAMAAVAVVITGVVGFVSIASADTETAIEGGFTGLQSLFDGTIAPAMFALVIAVVGVTLGVRWLRKAAGA